MASDDDIKAMHYSDVINTIIANIPEDEIRRLNSIIESHNGQPPESVHELAISTVDGVDFGIVIVDGCIEYSMYEEDTIDMIVTYWVEIERTKNRNYLIYSRDSDRPGLFAPLDIVDRVRDTKNIGLLIVLD